MKKFGAATLFIIGATLFFCLSVFSRRNKFTYQAHAARDSTAKTYLALGDSYTIGESVSAEENYPHLLTSALQKVGIKINDPEIRAVTGWTTGDLIGSLRLNPPELKKYDLVTLLIGVNNQYRGRTINEYEIEFRYLLDEAVAFAWDKKHVLVISIPDYSVTPFAEGSDRNGISRELDKFNNAQKKIAAEYGIQFINITPVSRRGKNDDSYQAGDGLHPSGMQYAEWVRLLLPPAKKILQKD